MKRLMANEKNDFKRVCIVALCVLPLILSGCRTAPTGKADPELPSGIEQSQQHQWQGTDTTESPVSQDAPDGNTPETPFDPVEMTQGPTDPPASQEPVQSPTEDTTVTEGSQFPSDPPPASDDPTENADSTGQETTEEAAGMDDESVPANTETGWGPIQ